MGILSLIGAKGLAYLGAALAAVIGIVTVYLRGISAGKTTAKVKQAEAYAETRKKIDAETHLGDDPAVLRDLLRARSKQQRDL